MEAQKQSQTHNFVLTTFLPSQQIKFISFIRLDAPKIIIHKGIELKFITGLVASTINTIKLYAIYQNFTAFQIGNWRLHEDIVGIFGWDKIIVVYTFQKIIGIKYENGHLKNSFMINLQFLNLQLQDCCSVFGDRLGNYLVIKVKNYILICFSELLIKKYKGNLIQKKQYTLVQQQVKWNQPNQKNIPIMSIIKIKLIQLGLCKMDQFSLGEDTIYFNGYQGKTSILYLIDIFYFFSTHNSQRQMLVSIFERGSINYQSKIICVKSKDINNPNPDILQVDNATKFIKYQTQEKLFQVYQLQKDEQILNLQSGIFPIIVYNKRQKKIIFIQKIRDFQLAYRFQKLLINQRVYAQKIIYREDGLIVYCSKNQMAIIDKTNKKQQLHKSLGKIIDIHVGKSMLLIQNYEDKYTRLYQICRGPKVLPKPHVTHKKKMFLQQLSDLQQIYTINIGNQLLLGVKQKKIFTFYKQQSTSFSKLLQNISEFYEIVLNQQKTIIIKKYNQIHGIWLRLIDNEIQQSSVQWQGWNMNKRWIVDKYIIAYNQEIWNFYQLQTKQVKVIQPFFNEELKKLNKFQVQIIKRQTVSQKQLKNHELFQFYLCYNNKLQIWIVNITNEQKYKIHFSTNLQLGCLTLSNQLLNQNDIQREKCRSITCPQYVMSQHGLRFTPLSQIKNVKNIKYFSCYQYQKKHLIIIVSTVNSEDQLFIYKRYFNIQNGSFIYRRIKTNLNVSKNFKFTTTLPNGYIGQKLFRIGNFFIYKGQLIQSIQARSVFQMQGIYWALLSENKIRQVHQLGNDVVDGFCIRQIQCSLKQQIMGIESSVHFYCVYSRKGFQVYDKQLTSNWKLNLGNQTIICLKLYQNFIGMSYYDYYTNQNGVNDYHSVKFRFRIYNCTFKAKSVQRQKFLQEPILHIKFLAQDKVLLVTSSLIFINIIKNDIMESFKSHNFSSKRSFLTSFCYIQDGKSILQKQTGKISFMLLGGYQGGITLYAGRWPQQDQLIQLTHEGVRCGVKDLSFFHYDQPKQQKLKCIFVDNEGNIIIMMFNMQGRCTGIKLADIRLSSKVNSLKSNSTQDKVMFCCCDDGSIKIITSVKIQGKGDKLDNESVSYLQFKDKFCNDLPFQGGFNARISRNLNQKLRSCKFVSRGNIFDNDILQQFFTLTSTLQQYMLTQSQIQMNALKVIIPF